MAVYSKLSDDQLITLLGEGNHTAYTEIYNRYFYLLYVHAYKKLRDEEQAKDVIQDIFTWLWFKREHNLPNSNVAAYLFTAVRNKIFDLFAHDKVRSNYLESLQDYFKTVKSPGTDYRIREKQLKDYIDKSIDELPPKMKVIFLMSRKEQLSYKEIAEQLDTTENNVSKQVQNALKILRTKFGLLLYLYFLIRH